MRSKVRVFVRAPFALVYDCRCYRYRCPLTLRYYQGNKGTAARLPHFHVDVCCVADVQFVFAQYMQSRDELNIVHWHRLLAQLKHLQEPDSNEQLDKDGHVASAEFAELQPPAAHLVKEQSKGSRLPQAPSKVTQPAAAPASRNRLDSKVNHVSAGPPVEDVKGSFRHSLYLFRGNDGIILWELCGSRRLHWRVSAALWEFQSAKSR